MEEIIKNILISVIVPAFNIEKYIGRCLDSLLLQTHDNLEIIVVDDGSTDSTGVIIDHYAEKDRRIIAIHEENCGVFSARLNGIKKARGEYIGFTDGDDFVESEMFEKLIVNALRYDADISHCGYQMVLGNKVDYYYGSGKIIVQDRLAALEALIGDSFIEPGLCNKLFRKELIKSNVDVIKAYEAIKINEDLLINYFFFKEAKRSVFEDICPYHYIVRRGSAATSKVTIYKMNNPITVREIIYADTERGSSVNGIALQDLALTLIRNSILKIDGYNKDIVESQDKVRSKLRGLLKEVLKSKYCRLKTKILVIWSVFFPKTYRFVHAVYSRMSGSKYKYNI